MFHNEKYRKLKYTVWILLILGGFLFIAAAGKRWKKKGRNKFICGKEWDLEEDSCNKMFEEKYSVLMSVCFKDSPEFLSDSIGSMMKQTVPCSQFVIVEDGPLEDSLSAVIDTYVQAYPELFTVVKIPENVGLGKALNTGIRYCRFELVARMDADDISLPNRCEKLLALFKEHPQLSIAGSNVDEFDKDPKNILLRRVVPSDYAGICRFMRRRSPFNHPTVMYRRSDVIRCGGYGKMRRKQDLDLFARMLNNHCYALNINESLLLFRADQDNYKRRKSWENCKSYIDVVIANYKRGYCSIVDLAVVCAGQMIFYISPVWLMKYLSDHLLRKI